MFLTMSIRSNGLAPGDVSVAMENSCSATPRMPIRMPPTCGSRFVRLLAVSARAKRRYAGRFRESQRVFHSLRRRGPKCGCSPCSARECRRFSAPRCRPRTPAATGRILGLANPRPSADTPSSPGRGRPSEGRRAGREKCPRHLPARSTKGPRHLGTRRRQLESAPWCVSEQQSDLRYFLGVAMRRLRHDAARIATSTR